MGMNVTGHKLIVFNGQGVFVCFDIEKTSLICTLTVKLKHNKLNSVHTSVCRNKDDMMFVHSPGSPTLSALYLTSSSATFQSSIRLSDTMEKNKQEIIKTFCHPVKPFVFVCYKKGSVQVWNYVAVRKFLVSKSGTDDSEQDGGGGFGGGGMGGGDSDDDNDDRSLDEDHSKRTKTKTEKDLLPVALLCPPDIEAGAPFHRAVISPCGRLCAASWGSSVCVYNVQLFPSKKQQQQQPGATGWRVPPLGSFTITPGMHLQSLGPLAFHPSEPLLFQVGDTDSYITCHYIHDISSRDVT